MKKIILLCVVSIIILTLLAHERSCAHQFKIQNNSSADTYKLYIIANFEGNEWETKSISPKTIVNKRINLNKFEGDLLLEAKNLESNKVLRAYAPYVYQGDTSNYIISINDDDLDVIDRTSSVGFINTVRFLFVSVSRYIGCYFTKIKSND